MKLKRKYFATRYKISEEFKEYCRKNKTTDGYELEPSIINFISWYDDKLRKGVNSP